MSEEKTISLKLSTQLKSELVEIDGEVYEVLELTGLLREKRLNSMKLMADNKGRVKDFAKLITPLIAMCLYKDGVLVTESVIRSWSGSTQQVLFDKCEELSLLSEDAKDDAKNA